MKAQSSTYMKLQSLYKAKARQDISDIVDIVRTLKGGGRIARGDVELFCKNAKFIKLVRSSEDAPSIGSIVGMCEEETVTIITNVND